MVDEHALSYKMTLQAQAMQVSRAFTSASALREWLCDISTTCPVVGGRVYLAWEAGYYAAGHFTHLTPGKQVSFTWLGKGDPRASQVDITIEDVDGHPMTRLTLVHSGLGAGPEWEAARQQIEKGWQVGLRNLKSTLEEGYDKRLTERPMIGIYTEDFSSLSEEKVRALNVPVNYGVLVGGLVPDLGAEKAGIQAGDLIVAINGHPMRQLKSIGEVVQDIKAGDELKVDLYRKSEKLSFTIETMTQLFPPVPETVEELAKEVENRGTKALETLDQLLDGVSEAEASFSPGAEEWSIKEVLVHLIHDERETHAWIGDLVAGQERSYDEWPGNQLFRIRATLAAYPSLNDLVAQYRRSLKETVALVAFIDPSFTQRKASFWRLGIGTVLPDQARS